MAILDVLQTLAAVAIMCLSLAGLWARPAWCGWIVFSIGAFGAAHVAALLLGVEAPPWDYLDHVPPAFFLVWILLFPILKVLLAHTFVGHSISRHAEDLLQRLEACAPWWPEQDLFSEERQFQRDVESYLERRAEAERRRAEDVDEDGLYRPR